MPNLQCPTCWSQFEIKHILESTTVLCPKCKLSLDVASNTIPDKPIIVKKPSSSLQHKAVNQNSQHAATLQSGVKSDTAGSIMAAVCLLGFVLISVTAIYALTNSGGTSNKSSYSSPSSYNFSEPQTGTTREHVRRTLREMESNVPRTLREMEDNLPNTMAEIERGMMRDAEKYGLSPSDVRSQMREMESGARDQIRGMEDDVKRQIRGMEDDVMRELQRTRGY